MDILVACTHRVSKQAPDFQGHIEYTGCSHYGGHIMTPHGTGDIHIHTVPTLCTLTVSSTAFGRYQTCVHAIQLNEIDAHVDFWMSGAHDNSVVLLVGVLKRTASKIPHSLYTRPAPESTKIHPITQSQGQFSPWSCQDLELSSLSKLSVKLF